MKKRILFAEKNIETLKATVSKYRFVTPARVLAMNGKNILQFFKHKM